MNAGKDLLWIAPGSQALIVQCLPLSDETFQVESCVIPVVRPADHIWKGSPFPIAANAQRRVGSLQGR